MSSLAQGPKEDLGGKLRTSVPMLGVQVGLWAGMRLAHLLTAGDWLGMVLGVLGESNYAPPILPSLLGLLLSRLPLRLPLGSLGPVTSLDRVG